MTKDLFVDVYPASCSKLPSNFAYFIGFGDTELGEDDHLRIGRRRLRVCK